MTTSVLDVLEVLREATSLGAPFVDRIRGLGAVAELQSIRAVRKFELDTDVEGELELRCALTKLLCKRIRSELSLREQLDALKTAVPNKHVTPAATTGCANKGSCAVSSSCEIPFLRWIYLADDLGLTRGAPIPNSTFYRDFCRACGEAMRVNWRQLRQLQFCARCEPSGLTGYASHQQSSSTPPSWDNAIRAIEDPR